MLYGQHQMACPRQTYVVPLLAGWLPALDLCPIQSITTSSPGATTRSERSGLRLNASSYAECDWRFRTLDWGVR